ncbi:MAG: hypothetical protein KAX19_14690, partial [Candidatus Brocadiae bacterium]|nr:hypothetical protein [Candidatus Brocadiia bacterium]
MAAHLLPALSAARPLREQEKLDNLCGPLCLTFCARWLGVEADVGRVAQMAGLDPISGTSFAGLARAAARLGLEARCYRLRLRDLR